MREHPFTSGFIAALSSYGISIVTALSDERNVRLIGAIGGLSGFVLTAMSIYFMYLKIKDFKK